MVQLLYQVTHRIGVSAAAQLQGAYLDRPTWTAPTSRLSPTRSRRGARQNRSPATGVQFYRGQPVAQTVRARRRSGRRQPGAHWISPPAAAALPVLARSPDLRPAWPSPRTSPVASARTRTRPYRLRAKLARARQHPRSFGVRRRAAHAAEIDKAVYARSEPPTARGGMITSAIAYSLVAPSGSVSTPDGHRGARPATGVCGMLAQDRP